MRWVLLLIFYIYKNNFELWNILMLCAAASSYYLCGIVPQYFPQIYLYASIITIFDFNVVTLLLTIITKSIQVKDNERTLIDIWLWTQYVHSTYRRTSSSVRAAGQHNLRDLTLLEVANQRKLLYNGRLSHWIRPMKMPCIYVTSMR